jgi:hypothetical protein
VNVIDIDPRHDGEGWLTENAARLPGTRIVRTMSGGVHLYFRLGGEELRNSAGKSKAGKGIAAGVDVRGEGGYVIVPPSAGYAIEDARPPADMPGWLLDLCRKPADNPPPPPPQTAPARPQDDGAPYARAALESACAAIRNAPEGGKHETINREAYSIGGLAGQGDIGEGQAYAALQDALHALAQRGTIKDFRAAEKALRRAFQEGKGKPRAIPDLPGRYPADDADVDISGFMAKHAGGGAALQRAAAAKPLPVAPALYDVPGAMALWLEYCAATSISPQPFLALAAGIAAMGALGGRKYRTGTDLRSNFFVVGIGESASGKDHARRCVKKAFAKAGLTKYLGGEDIASGTAMITALTRHPCMLFQIDEFGDWLGEVLGAKSAPHKKQISQKFRTLYSSANSMITGVEYADQSKIGKPREDIYEPHACLFGTATPKQYWRALQASSLEDGLAARFMTFITPDPHPDHQRPALIDPPAALVEAFQAIAAGVQNGTGGNLAGEMIAGVQPEPYTVPMTDDAQEAFDELGRHQLRRLRSGTGSDMTSIVGRLRENATKLALLRAISRNASAPVMELSDMAWGQALAEHCTDTLVREAGDNVADSEYEKKVARAKNIIRRFGPVTERDLWQRGFKVAEREKREILDSLARGGDIEIQEYPAGPKGGRPTIRYSISPSQA